MVLNTKPFFDLIRIHHMLGKGAREADLAGRLRAYAECDGLAQTKLTQRCMRLFLARRQPRDTSRPLRHPHAGQSDLPA